MNTTVSSTDLVHLKPGSDGHTILLMQKQHDACVHGGRASHHATDPDMPQGLHVKKNGSGISMPTVGGCVMAGCACHATDPAGMPQGLHVKKNGSGISMLGWIDWLVVETMQSKGMQRKKQKALAFLG